MNENSDNQNPDKSLAVFVEPDLRPPGPRQRVGAWWKRQQPRLKVAQRVLLILAVVAALWSHQWREGLTGLWISLNIGYGMVACLWALVHGRAVWQTRDSALRWAICLSVFSVLLLYTVKYQEFNNLDDISTSSAGGEGNATIWLLLIWLVAFCGLMLLALVGAAIGSFAGRKSGDSERSAHTGITLSMASALLFMLALSSILKRFVPGRLGLTLCFFSFPLLTRLYIHTLQHSARPLRHSLQPVTHKITACLVWRLRLPAFKFQQKGMERKIVYRLDMRGIALGFVVAALLLRVDARFIGPLQSLALTTLTHLYSVRSLPFSLPPLPTQIEPGPRDRFVILHMDPQTRYDAHQRSEAAVQAEMIALLHKRGVARIILALPYLHNNMVTTWTSRNEGMAPDQQDVEHSRRDTRKLADVVLRTPDVLLAIPPTANFDDSVEQRLLNAAPVGGSKLLRSSATYLPIVPATWTGITPLPALLCASLKMPSTSSTPDINAAPVSRPSQSNPNISPKATPPLTNQHQLSNTLSSSSRFPPPASLSAIPGCAHPKIDPEGVLINFVGEGPHEDFLHITYAEVRANAPVLTFQTVSSPDKGSPVPPPPKAPSSANFANSPSKSSADSNYFEVPASVTGEWKPAADLLRGRVVFLDSLAHPMVSTPAGVMTQSEAQAYAVSTLLSRERFQRAPRFLFTCLLLLLGMEVGYICSRHEPLDAGIRLLLPLLLVLAGSTAAFLVFDYWFDPVLPLLTMGATAALATQFRFARERAEKQRASDLFGRFVAPHMVQFWLRQHEDELDMGGAREKICVLFADVRQFTTFAEQHDATEVIEVINAYMTVLTDALHAHGGILDKYTGDGLMAFFHITHSPQEDVTRAVQAALAMRDAVQTLSAQQAQDGKPVLELGISLHYGDAIVGLMGNPKLQVNYTVMGLTVVVAARLQTIAKGGDVIVSEEVYLETRNAFEFTIGEPVQVKGLTQAVRPYRVLAAQQENTP